MSHTTSITGEEPENAEFQRSLRLGLPKNLVDDTYHGSSNVQDGSAASGSVVVCRTRRRYAPGKS
jgi:hypothetical protein